MANGKVEDLGFYFNKNLQNGFVVPLHVVLVNPREENTHAGERMIVYRYYKF